MSNATTEFYLALNSQSRAIIETSTLDPRSFGKAQELIQDFATWTGFQAFGPENIAMFAALNEAATGMYLLSSGLYRSSFKALRLFLELSLGSIHFSANRLELAEWVDGRRDIVWASLVDDSSGVLSQRYTQAFFPELSEEVGSANSKVRKVYRRLSEYVHGNRLTLRPFSEQIAHSEEASQIWFECFFEAAEIVLTALSVRFLKELQPGEREKIASATRENIGYLRAVREFLEGA